MVPKKIKEFSSKISRYDWECSSVVEHLPSMQKSPDSIPSTGKKKKSSNTGPKQ
jgi:hypothetical protein